VYIYLIPHTAEQLHSLSLKLRLIKYQVHSLPAVLPATPPSPHLKEFILSSYAI